MLLGKVITLGVVVLVIGASVYLVGDTKKRGSKGEKERKKFGERIRGAQKKVVKMANGPKIYVRMTSGEPYVEFQMDQPKFIIGSGAGADLRIESDEMDEKQLMIVREMNLDREDDTVFYSIKSYGKVNLTEYFNPLKRAYEWMRTKETIDLNGVDRFYIGNVKIKISVPGGHVIDDTDVEHSKIKKTVKKKRNLKRYGNPRQATGRQYDKEDVDC